MPGAGAAHTSALCRDTGARSGSGAVHWRMPTTRRGASARRPEAGVENAPAGYGAAGGVSFSSDIPAETGSSTAQDAQPMLALAKSGANVQWIDPLGIKVHHK